MRGDSLGRLALISVLLALAAGGTCADCIALRPGAAWVERAAAGDLQRAIHAATGRLLPVRATRGDDANVIAVGFAPMNGVDLSAKTLGDQGFVLKTFESGGKRTLVAAGATPVATSYACYTLAEHYGAGFYLGGDALAQSKRPFGLPALDLVKKPALAIRGVLPWYNFFDSPTAWNAEDYRFFIDQLAKSKNNFLGFHSYDFEPFCAYINKDGHLTAGAPLASTKTPTWGTVSMKTSEFGFGTDRYFAREYFGADCSMDFTTPEDGIAKAKKLLADALWYAKARGVKTCVGFEVTGDPTAPGEIENLELRLRTLIRDYPMLDYVWIWEPEAMGLSGSAVHPIRSDFGAYYRRWESHFADITDPRRKSEAVRVGIYATAAHRILKREAPRLRMILSGWGGDNHLHFTDFYPGLDQILPKDIIFSALDDIIVSDTVSAAYGKLSRDREFWPIPWFEYDGDQWFPQPNTKRFFNNARDAVKKGAKGLLGIHWRTRDVEESHAYVSQFAWNTDLGYEGFYRGYAERRYGDVRAARLLMALQELGYRWIGGPGQMECGAFAWSPAPEGAVDRVVAAFGANKGIRPSESLNYLTATRDWALGFDNAARLLLGGGEIRALLGTLRSERRQPTSEERQVLLDSLNQAAGFLGSGMTAYSTRISNRGELGTLATINAKAWADLGTLAREALGDAEAPSIDRPMNPPLAVRSVLRLTTAYAGQPFRVSAVVDGASPKARAEVVYRAPGGRFQSAPLEFANKGLLEGVVPASAAKGDILEYYVNVTDEGGPATWPKGAPASLERLTVVPAPKQAPEPKPRPAARVASPCRVSCKPGIMSVQIEWTDQPAVRLFRVMRKAQRDGEWEDVGTTFDSWFEDRGVLANSSYSYRVIDSATGVKLGESEVVTIPEPPVPGAPEVTLKALPGRVRVRVALMGEEAGGMRVYRSEKANGPFAALDLPDVAGSPDVPRSRFVEAEPGKVMYYQVRALSLASKEGPPSETVSAAALPADGPPIVSLDLSGADAVEAKVTGGRVDEDGVPALLASHDDFAQLPHSDAYNTGEDLSIEFWVKLKSAGTMPVFVCHGAWESEGFFVQYLGGSVRFFLGGVGVLDAGALVIGRWTHIAATYDGAEMRLYLNGKLAGARPAMGAIIPSYKPLYVGRYELWDKAYDVDGFITAFRLYGYALDDKQVAAHYGRLEAKLVRGAK